MTELPGVDWTFDSRDTAFMDHAACAGYDPRYWDTVTRGGVTTRLGSVRISGKRIPRFQQIGFAKAVCASCPVISECAAFVRDHPAPENIWAGMLPDERIRAHAGSSY